MKVSMKAAVTAACVVAAASAVACSGFYAGRLTTADGTTLIGRTADYHPYSAASRIIKVEAGAASNRYAHVQTPKVTALKRGPYAGGSVNEKGLMFTGTVTTDSCAAATNADPFVSAKMGGVGEADLPGLIIGNCATAREGVKRLGEEIAKHGHRAPDIYLLADRTEAWYMEVYTGHQWAAVKMPEDKVAVFGNQFMLGAFATNRTDVLFSPGLVSTAVKGKFIKWVDEKKGIVNLFDTYSDGLQTHSTYRAWYGRHLLAPGTEGVYATNRVMELFYTPKKKVVLSDFFNLMRSRYEGSAACPEERPGAPYRVFGVAMQGNCHVLQMRHDLPPATCATAWVCVGPSAHGVFMPVNAATRTVWPAYSRDQTEGPFRADPERAGDAFLALATLAEAQTHTFTNGPSGPVWVDLRPRYGNGVRDFWAKCEQRFVSEWPAIVSSGDVAAITAYTTNVQARAFADAKRIYDDLLWYAAENNHIAADGGKKSEIYDPPFKPSERKLIWSDEFNGPALDTNIWRRIDRGSSDWNRHMSTRDDLLEMRDGCVVLVGKVNTQTNADPRPFLTGGITNRDTDRARHFRYGKVEMRVKLEDQKGAWPALWMCSLDRDRQGRGYPWNGEIDIVERLNGDPFVYHTVHSGWTLDMKHPNDPPHGGKGAIRPGEFNVYGFERTKDALIWSVNGKETFRYPRTKGGHPDQWPFDNSHFFYLDMQLSGKWVGNVDMSTLPVRMWIDWLRVYE